MNSACYISYAIKEIPLVLVYIKILQFMLKIHSRILPNYCLLAQMFMDEELRFFFLVHNKLFLKFQRKGRVATGVIF
jgi:hypothetical protein